MNKSEIKTIAFKSILAGLCIGISSLLYLKIDNKIIGALLFSLGLITIMKNNLKLYTGIIGYTKTIKDYINAFEVYIGNLIGIMILYFYYNEDYVIFFNNKLNKPLYITFINAIICGMLIFISVDDWKENKSLVTTFFAVPIFILCGGEHSIADLAYMFAAHSFNKESIIFITVVTIGNAVGSLLNHRMLKESRK